MSRAHAVRSICRCGRRLFLPSVAVSLVLTGALAAAARPSAPQPGTVIPGGRLFSVSAVSASDAWAVGTLGLTGAVPLILHWNGITWSRVPIARSVATGIGAVSAASASEAWALAGQLHQAAALHWNGTSWSKVLILPGDRLAVPFAVSDAGPKNAWAVGQRGDKTLTVHWDGAAWSQVPSPSPGQVCQPCAGLVDKLSGVAIISKSDAWAVGAYTTSTAVAALTLHWNGTKWVRVPNQAGSTRTTALEGVSMVSATDGWAVGGDATGTLILHWNGATWARS